MQPGDRLAHYEIIALLGTGGMGEVYLAQDTRLGREVALKFLRGGRDADPTALVRFRSEARTLAALDHRNIVVIHSVEDGPDGPFIAMAHVRGRPLSACIPPGGFAVARWRNLALPMAEAVAAAHRAGVIHRDLKPANVMLTDNDEVRILDFGLAKINHLPGTMADETVGLVTLPGALLGTLPYMSPEQVQGRALTFASDVFSLGAVLYEMATGLRPFTAASAAELASAILRDAPAPLAQIRVDLPARWAAAVDRCLEKDPALRFPDAGGLAAALAEETSTPAEAAAATVSTRFAVLDFENLTRAADADWLATGIAETVTADLQRLPGVTVTPREQVVAAWKARGASDEAAVIDVGRALRVAFLIRGAYQRSGERIRITGHVLDVAAGALAGSVKLDGTMDGIFELQDRVLASLLVSARLEIADSDLARIERRETTALQASESYARGRELLLYMGAGDFREAEVHLLDALEMDPDYALAHVAFGQMRAMGYIATTDVRDLHEAIVHLEHALASDPDLGEPHVWMSYCLARLGRFDEAIAAGERAVAHDRDRPQAHYFAGTAWWLRGMEDHVEGDWEAALPLVARSLRLQPSYQPAAMMLADLLVRVNRDDEARRALEQAVALEESGRGDGARFVGAGTLLGLLDLRHGDLAAADRRLADSWERLAGSGHVYAPQFRVLTLLGQALLADARRRQPEAIELLNAALGLGDRHLRSLGMGRLVARVGFTLARVLALAGNEPAATERLRLTERLWLDRPRFDFSGIWAAADAEILLDQAAALSALGREDEAGTIRRLAITKGAPLSPRQR